MHQALEVSSSLLVNNCCYLVKLAIRDSGERKVKRETLVIMDILVLWEDMVNPAKLAMMEIQVSEDKMVFLEGQGRMESMEKMLFSIHILCIH